MAGRIIAQIIVHGTTFFSKIFFSAYKQALHNAKNGAPVSESVSKFKMQQDEALKILDIDKLSLNKRTVNEKYKKFFEINDPKKGGSFYLQSKIYRAKEVLDHSLSNPESIGNKKQTNKKT